MTDTISNEELEELEANVRKYGPGWSGVVYRGPEKALELISLAKAGLNAQPQPIKTAPKDGTIVLGTESFKWVKYKPGAPDYLKKKGGRWQKFNGYGWDNAVPPEYWLPTPPQEGK